MPDWILPAIFGLSVFCCVYPYTVHPILSWLILKLAPSRTAVAEEFNEAELPTVTVIVPMHNEAASAQTKIENTLEGQYPDHLIHLIVVADHRTDDTEEQISRCGDPRVSMIRSEGGNGKNHCLNQAVPMAEGEIIVMTDASCALGPGAIRNMIRPFAKPEVGLVSIPKYQVGTGQGSQGSQGGTLSKLRNAFLGFDSISKAAESKLGCLVGGIGALIAMRRSLWEAVPDDVCNDLQIPLRLVAQGHQVVTAQDVECLLGPSKSLGKEMARRTRIISRSIRPATWALGQYLKRGRLAALFFLAGRKLAFYFAPVFMILALVSNALLAPSGPIWLGLLVLQVALYLLAFLGIKLSECGNPLAKLLGIPGQFLALNLGVLTGLWYVLRHGHGMVTWSTAQRAIPGADKGSAAG